MEKNKMATAPVGRLMLGMGIPMILSMMLQAVYNIVDSAFVANMAVGGEQALNALTLAFPVQMMMVAVSIGTGVGMNALMSRNLGQGDRDMASRAVGNTIFLAAVIYAVFLLFGISGTGAYVRSQSSNPEIVQMAEEYIRIGCTLSFGMIFFSVFEKTLQASGRSVYSTIAQVAGAVTNIVLDPVLIYGWLGLPEMGVVGAALATVIGQVVSCALALVFHLRLIKEIDNGWRFMKPSGAVIWKIYSIGLPAVIAQALMSVMTYGLNLILVQISENAVTAYGLYYKIQQFILFAAFGLRDAITPVVSFNYGMGSRGRVKQGIKFGMLYTLAIMAVGIILMEVLAEPFPALFGLSGETRQMCTGAMRIVSLSFLFAGANVAFQGIFQALESGVQSLVISVCRQFLFVLPVAWGFSRVVISSGTDYMWLVWLTFFIAEGISAAIALIFMRGIRIKRIDTL